jgi:hypothetical protein
MDILSDILHVAGLRRRLLDLHGLTPEAALRFPCERSFGLHAVTRGRAFVHAPNLDEPLELQAGDLVLMARGCVHLLSLDREPPERSTTVPIARFAGSNLAHASKTGHRTPHRTVRCPATRPRPRKSSAPPTSSGTTRCTRSCAACRRGSCCAATACPSCRRCR